LAITQPKEPKRLNNHKCPCGFYHDVLKCFTLNPKAERRPQGFKPNLKALRNCLNAFKYPELLKKVKKLYRDNNMQWTFDIVKASAEAESRSEGSTRVYSTDQGRRPNADRIENTVASEDYYAPR
jgi:hypothetical protein